MSLLSDILKEIPLSTVLREKISALETENASLKTENAILKDDVRQLRQKLEKLKESAQSASPTFALDDTMERILILLAQHGEEEDSDGVDKNALASALKLTVARVEYYLHILEEQEYIFGVHNYLGYPSTYHLTHKAREFLIKKNLI